MSNTPFEHLHAIELPTPFPVGPVTVYLADAPGEPLTLLDTGPLHPPTWSALQAGLAALGYAAGPTWSGSSSATPTSTTLAWPPTWSTLRAPRC